MGMGQFTEIHYSWADEGKPQEGRNILGRASQGGLVQAVWFDTWYMAKGFIYRLTSVMNGRAALRNLFGHSS
jgi:hypothetical protein